MEEKASSSLPPSTSPGLNLLLVVTQGSWDCSSSVMIMVLGLVTVESLIEALCLGLSKFSENTSKP